MAGRRHGRVRFRRSRAAAVALPFALLAAACLSPVRRPPAPLVETRRGGSPEALARDAAARWAKRPDIDAVRAAARSWMEAAAGTAGGEPLFDRLVGAVRAYVWLAAHEHAAEARERAAERALDAARHCTERFPRRAACQYWFAVALGVTAREKPTTSHKAIAMMIEALERSIETDPALENGGPHRVLALVYLRAPGWPAGPGDDELGLEQARRAAALAPDYPPNLLALGEALAKNGHRDEALQAFAEARDLAEQLERQGDPDAGEWRAEAAERLRRLGGGA